MNPTAAALADQFERVRAEMRDAIANTPDDEWTTAAPLADSYLAPARQALHTVSTIEAYLCGSPDAAWGPNAKARRFPVDWEEAPADRLPSRTELRSFLDDVVDQLVERLKGLDDAALAAPSAFPWTGPNVAGHWMYALRHTQHHFAVMNTMLRAKTKPTAEWK